ncbi:MAG: signal recognition particle-docking protein FtsY [Rhodospirillales bacterium]|nr:signal recognition particle-docking protein FtsY [Rhodospirillales bacterium]
MSDAGGKGWLGRLRAGLGRSSAKLAGGISDLFTRRKLDDTALEDLEELLIAGDLGVGTSARLTQSISKSRFGKDVTPDEIRSALADEVTAILEPVARPLVIKPDLKPHVILVCGVNGSGKTTTIGKLARRMKTEGHSVMIAAADTFRAAATEQLQIWGERTGCPVISAKPGADAGGLAYDALAQARAGQVDVLLIDTAGRLQNKAGLMDELKKIVRVLKKLDDSAPHDCILVMDATIGQNAINQVEVFKDMVNVSGLVLTKLDGSAKGGIIVALAEKFGLPVHAVGVGEGADDMQPFEARQFARSLLDLA